ncbi:MAG: primosomal protein N' [Oligosphaeraceae bacterium]
MFAEVAFNLATGQCFDYAVPEEWPQGKVYPGCRVRASFRGVEQSGYVLKLKENSSYRALPLVAVEDASRQFPPQMLRLADWICDYYCASHECVIWNLLPAVVRRGEMQHREVTYLDLTEKARDPGSDAFMALTPKRQQVLRTLIRLGGSLPLKEALGAVDAGQSVIHALVADGWLAKCRRVEERDPFRNALIQRDAPKTLTEEQAAALAAVKEALETPRPKPILLHGVTGSGKTEIYLQAIEHCLNQGRNAIVLVPEIALTPQTVFRFRQRFGEQVSVLHSGLTDGQRFDEWTRIAGGRSRIAVGARSALFAPFRNLGLIVVDEEHEATYKQDEMPHYNARDVAVVRGMLESCAVVLGSATPSLESYHNCTLGKYRLVEMKSRVDGHPLPTVEVVDMRLEHSRQKEKGQSSFFSRRLKELIDQTLARHQQVILFLNRRGYATTLSCSQCGYTASCENCSVTYTYHRKQNKLMCHHCDTTLDAPSRCPDCGNPEIRMGGYGTERVEAVTRAIFPHAMVARMDSDTMTNADSYRKVLEAFRGHRIDILIGTQMIAKGLDFPDVTLVGIIQADIGLNLPDFRSAERTFALITQVAGRAGRGAEPGRVVVQTCTPDNYAIASAQRHDYAAFAAEELPGRHAMAFPPYAHLVLLQFRHEQDAVASQAAEQFASLLNPLLPRNTHCLGPMAAPLARLSGKFRYQILLRGENVRGIVDACRKGMAALSPAQRRKVPVEVDVDPRFLQ